MVTDPSFWRGKRVLVTGHTGFKGGWLSLWLRKLGADVSGLALAPASRPNLYEDARVAQQIHSVHGDIRSRDTVAGLLNEKQIEIVFHLAAQALVLPSYENPIETYSTNVVGTATVLDAMRSAPQTRACVVVTSDKCYENRDWPWPYREEDALGGYDPYSSSKACTELVAKAFRSSYFVSGERPVAIATARAGNVIGGGDWSEHRIIPDIVRAIRSRDVLSIRRPQAVRPWQHVLEPLAGYLALAQRLYGHGDGAASAWNFGPDRDHEQPVRWLVDYASRYGLNVKFDPAGPHEASYLTLDSSKAHRHLGWRGLLSMEATLDWTFAWYKDQAAGADAAQLCLDQIHRYESLSNATE